MALILYSGGGSNPGASSYLLVWFSNPGLAHPALRAQWAPTLRRFSCQRTPTINATAASAASAAAAAAAAASVGESGHSTKLDTDALPQSRWALMPVLVTCHSAADLARDAKQVTSDVRFGPSQTTLWRLPPAVNPFRSRRGVVDASEARRATQRRETQAAAGEEQQQGREEGEEDGGDEADGAVVQANYGAFAFYW